MPRFLATLALFLLASTHARADTLVWRHDFNAGNSLLFRFLGDDHVPWTGKVVSTKVVFEDYVTDGELDTSSFRFTFDVPVLGDGWVELSAGFMGWSGQGPVSYVYESTAHNGEIREGRFGGEVSTCHEPPCGEGTAAFLTAGYIELIIEGQRIDPIFQGNFDDTP